VTAPILFDHRGQPVSSSFMVGDYEGASNSRRLSAWGLGVSGPTASLSHSLTSLRSRCRKLSMNEPQIDGGLDTLAANLVGTGITPRWQLEDSGLKAEIQALWADWVKEADADGVTDFYGLQSLVARSMIESGEVLSRDIYRRQEEDLVVPVQIQVLEADHLDETYNTINPETGNEIRFGIEFDGSGRRAAYHLYKEHPAENFLLANPTIRHRIGADEVRHVYRPLRPGQKRGRPWLAAAILVMHEMAKYDDAELVRKTAAAMFGGFITETTPGPNPPGQGAFGQPSMTDGKGREIIPLEPGTFPLLPRGMDVKFSAPADVGGNYEAFTKRQEHRVAKGFGGLTYEKFTGDLADASYSSIRGGNLEAQRVWKMVIYNVLVHQFCQPSTAVFLRQAVLTGKIKIKDFLANHRKYLRIKWCIDGWPWVDPVKDQVAERMAIRGGLKSRAESVAERGRDVEEVDEEIRADNERVDRLGLVLDTDPRSTANNGSAVSRKTNDGESDA
jgi:lambda family phage portal protein